MKCTPHYIRCIKPNETKKPRDWEESRYVKMADGEAEAGGGGPWYMFPLLKRATLRQGQKQFKSFLGVFHVFVS